MFLQGWFGDNHPYLTSHEWTINFIYLSHLYIQLVSGKSAIPHLKDSMSDLKLVPYFYFYDPPL